MSKFFIHRPNFAWVVAIFIALAGLLSLPKLPVAQYPTVAPPQINIQATYPGASATLISESVISVIEEELNGAKNLLYYDSSANSTGFGEITVTFEPGTDIDLAQVDIQNRIKKAEARLPVAVVQQGLQIEQANTGFLMIIALGYKEGAKNQDQIALADYVVRHVNNEIRRLPGVGKLQFFATESAMRVWIDPQKLLGYGLSVADVNAAIAAQNLQVPAGSFGARPGSAEQELTATIVVKGTLDDAREFANIVLRANPDGSQVTLGDVARMEIGRQNYLFDSRVNGKNGIASAVLLSPGANALETARAVSKRLEELSAGFPDDIEYSIPYDTSRFVDVAIGKVLQTLAEAILLVFLVIFLFLQNLRYTLIPIIVVPVSLLGTMSVMLLFGFSVNMMTMFGMVLAIGILVDDAIVVVENVERIMAEEGLAPVPATIKAMQQVSGAIVGITVVLAAVFLPLAFMSGSVGVIYRQFSLALAVSILFSGFLALSLTPALCATLLRPIKDHEQQEKKGFFGIFNRRFNTFSQGYASLTQRLLQTTGRYMLIYLAIVIGLGWMFARMPASFVPAEDQGYYLVNAQLPPGATYARTEKIVKQMEEHILSRPATDSVVMILGFSFAGSGENAALGFPSLIDWSKRGSGSTVNDEVAAFNARFGGSTEASLMAVNPPTIDGMGTASGFSLRLQDRGGLGHEALIAARNQLLGEAFAKPSILYAMMEGLEDAPQLRLDIDRDQARAMGVDFAAIRTAISSAFGSATINDFANAGRLQRVVVQADISERMTPESLLQLYIPNNRGEQVPLSAFATTRWKVGPVQLNRYNGYPALKISGDAKPGFSSSEVMADVEDILSRLPKGIGYEWTGLSYQERFAGAQAPLLFTLAILVVFLVLVALYESWAIPLSVMLIVPIGALGSVLASSSLGLANDVYFKVGLITIIGLATKNAILIVEFAKSLHEAGHSLRESAVMAARLRFRPILMTSLAFILGVLPLAIASGAGGASQRALGTGVIGGMLSVTILGIIFIPIFYVWVLKLLWRGKQPKSSLPATETNNAHIAHPGA
jgi:multidrug efflux pump